MRYLVTGCSGFIGFHLCRRLLRDGNEVVGLDNMNSYYDVRLKEERLALLRRSPGFAFVLADIADEQSVAGIFAAATFDAVIHLAAQAGVRYSIDHPEAYIQSNLVGFSNVIRQCQLAQVGHFVYASSSSVYGANTRPVFSESDPVDHPISLYAATKRADELIAHAYSHLFGLPTTGMRLFTVYGPWGRPDMALFLFTDAIFHDRPVTLYNNGNMYRDFTYIDDVIEAVTRLISLPPKSVTNSESMDSPASSMAPFQVLNIGHGSPVRVGDCVDLIERRLGKTARRIAAPLQPGDVVSTHADITSLTNRMSFAPATGVETGIPRMIDWYLEWTHGMGQD